jgi:hypothetical protein
MGAGLSSIPGPSALAAGAPELPPRFLGLFLLNEP